jgi:predicted transposase/invertase (TIGR01784 family)
LPRFGKAIHEVSSEADKWIYLLKNMPELQDIPAELANEPFTHAFEMAEQSALSPSERLLYEASLKSARDTYAEIMTAREEGREEGIEEGMETSRRAIARSMMARGLDIKLIAELTQVNEAALRDLLP